MNKIVSRKDVAIIAKELLVKVASTNKDTATVLSLSGDLGAGKTTLTQELAKELGIKEKVSSPTFVLMKIYNTKNKKYFFKKLIHIDAYRIEKNDKLDFLRLHDFLAEKENLIIVEWPEKIKKIIKNVDQKVFIKHHSEDSRVFDF